jgi:tight adherence protein B
MNTLMLITLVVFLTVALMVFGLYYAITAASQSERSEVRRRLQAIALRNPNDEDMPSLIKQEILSDVPALNWLLFKLPFAEQAERLLDQSDVKLRVGTLFLLTLVLFVAGLALGIFVRHGLVLGLILGVVLSVLPFAYLVYMKDKRLRKFTELFPDTLDMLARSLRAGHSFTSALQVVAEEMPDPVSKVFKIAYDEQSLGLSLSESLSNMTVRINSMDLAFFVTAVNIQRETGGNLAEILEKLGVTIRERFKILGQLRIYTAQGKLSGYILAVLPLVLALIIWVINPGYLQILLKHKLGMYLIAAGVLLQLTGFFVIRKIIDIEI